jgi:hypothetical protein
LHFPYTAPSVLPGEVAIEFGLTGPYVILIGGATAAVDGIWQVGRMIAGGQCERGIVLAVETFVECEALWRRARWALPGPLVETAACVLVGPGDTPPEYRASATPALLERQVDTRVGRTMAGAPLAELALARAAASRRALVSGTWRGRTAAIEMAIAGRPVRV